MLTDLYGALSPSAAVFVRAIESRPDLPERLAHMSMVFHERGQKSDAKLLAREALRLGPAIHKVRLYTEWLVRREAPVWHFGIVADAPRNQAYRRALERWVKPGITVLEIGTGTGLLSMLAVRAGADHVYTCERSPDVAAAACSIIARNGMSDKITVIAKEAAQVKLGRDIPHRADLFVSELVDNGLLSEHVLPLTGLARDYFLKPDAIILPSVIESRACLVSARGYEHCFRMDWAEGFDLREFNRFSPVTVSGGRGGGQPEQLSDTKTIISFDLRSKTLPSNPQATRFEVTKAGTVVGLLRWHRLDFGDNIFFENPPGTESAWYPHLHLFEPLEVAIGSHYDVWVSHSQSNLFINSEP